MSQSDVEIRVTVTDTGPVALVSGDGPFEYVLRLPADYDPHADHGMLAAQLVTEYLNAR